MENWSRGEAEEGWCGGGGGGGTRDEVILDRLTSRCRIVAIPNPTCPTTTKLQSTTAITTAILTNSSTKFQPQPPCLQILRE